MICFETIGSATLIVHDDGPILTTDPWVNHGAYFGSWSHDYEIPAAQMDSIRRAKFHWFSHGHPDHLNVDSIPLLTSGQFLLSDHFGSRIHNDLTSAGHKVQILPDRKWVQLSKHVKVCSFPNSNQDSVLLIDVNGHLVIDANDSPDLGQSWHIKRIAKAYKNTYLCQLHGWGGADMLNLFDSSGKPLKDLAALKRPIAPRSQRAAMNFGANHVIPFSSFHRYQRTDSAWANAMVPELDDYQRDATPGGAIVLPAFVRVDCVAGHIDAINPNRAVLELKNPEKFDDSWTDVLEAEDISLIDKYFREREHLAKHFGFIEVSAGGRSHAVRLNKGLGDMGITFECPRNSLMTSIRYEIFDDLLIGNFMKTTLHGVDDLYPNFSPYVAKYGDNGGSKSHVELKKYFHHYLMRDPIGILMTNFQTNSEMLFRSFIKEDSKVFKAAKKIFYSIGRRKQSS